MSQSQKQTVGAETPSVSESVNGGGVTTAAVVSTSTTNPQSQTNEIFRPVVAPSMRVVNAAAPASSLPGAQRPQPPPPSLGQTASSLVFRKESLPNQSQQQQHPPLITLTPSRPQSQSQPQPICVCVRDNASGRVIAITPAINHAQSLNQNQSQPTQMSVLRPVSTIRVLNAPRPASSLPSFGGGIRFLNQAQQQQPQPPRATDPASTPTSREGSNFASQSHSQQNQGAVYLQHSTTRAPQSVPVITPSQAHALRQLIFVGRAAAPTNTNSSSTTTSSTTPAQWPTSGIRFLNVYPTGAARPVCPTTPMPPSLAQPASSFVIKRKDSGLVQVQRSPNPTYVARVSIPSMIRRGNQNESDVHQIAQVAPKPLKADNNEQEIVRVDKAPTAKSIPIPINIGNPEAEKENPVPVPAPVPDATRRSATTTTENPGPTPTPKREPQLFRWAQLMAKPCSGAVEPIPRHGHRAIPIDDKQVVILGGGNEGLYGDMHILDLEKMEWFQPRVRGDAPPPLAGFALVYDQTIEPRILLFGGMEEFYKYSNDLYELKYNRDEDVWIWRKLNPLPSRDPEYPLPLPRLGHSFTIINNKVYLFGGIANISNYSPPPEYREYGFIPLPVNDLFVLNIRSNYPHGMWDLPMTFGYQPGPRESHSAVAYSKSTFFNKIIIYGGGMCGTRLSDVFVLDVDTMYWSRTAAHMPYSPGGRSLHSSSLVGPRMYVFGGWTEVKHSQPQPQPQSEQQQQQQSQEESNVAGGSEVKLDSAERWTCTKKVACLNVETMAWEWVKPDPSISLLPPPRAGHCAFTVNNFIYIWSGRDGYLKEGGRQVCFNDLWRLDVKPASPLE